MGVFLSELTYEQLDPIIDKNTVVMLPIGCGAKEHGRHLPMGTDFFVTEWFAKQVTQRCEVVTLPILSYGYFPAFVEWKGTVSIDYRKFTDFVQDILKSFIRFGVKKFLILDGGVSTHAPLCLMARDLDRELHVKVAVSDITALGAGAEEQVCEQEKGGHGDETETSTMLYIREDLVHMEKAEEAYCEDFPGTKVNGRTVVNVPTAMNTFCGINGNSRLASKEKGEKILYAALDELCNFADHFRAYNLEEEEKHDR